MSTNEFDELDEMIEQTDLSFDESELDPDLVPEDAVYEKPSRKGSSKKSSKANKQPVLSEEDEKIESIDEVYWYVVHCYSGYENKVCHNLEQRIETMGMKDMIFDVIVPQQEEIEIKDGKRKTIKRNIFPGYVLVQMKMTEQSWFIVRNTPGVTGFIGMGKQPTPLRPEEAREIFKRAEAEAPHLNVTFKEGEKVRIIDGPFNDFTGVVSGCVILPGLNFVEGRNARYYHQGVYCGKEIKSCCKVEFDCR